jgi:hypothetical protein
MQTLTYVLYQIDEALRYIAGGRLEQLRLALLLLDNAAELQVDRRVREERGSEDLLERIRSQAIAVGAIPSAPGLEELAAWEPLTAAAKKRIERLYDAKLEYLVSGKPALDQRVANVLSYLHRYRNEAYHEGRVRRETIRTAAIILVEANCELLTTIFRVRMYASDEDYSWVTKRFALGQTFTLSSSDLEGVAADLRASTVLASAGVSTTLAAHLRSRVEELLDALDFVADATALESRAAVLRFAQFGAAIDRGDVRPDSHPARFQPAWSLARISGLRGAIAAVERTVDRLAAFEAFSAVEREIESLEREVYDLAHQVDSEIQFQVDLARGK